MFNDREPVKEIRAAFVDGSGIKWDPNRAELENYFQKKEVNWMGMQSNRSLYFILKGNQIFFAKDPVEAPIGMIDLTNSIEIILMKSDCMQIITSKETYELTSESTENIQIWYNSISNILLERKLMNLG